jgi:hypothetical protein
MRLSRKIHSPGFLVEADQGLSEADGWAADRLRIDVSSTEAEEVATIESEPGIYYPARSLDNIHIHHVLTT